MASESYLNKESYIKRMTSGDQIADVYNEWSNSYEKDNLVFLDYSLRHVFNFLERYIPRRDAAILDVGAGTGMGGDELQRRGYTCIDAVDPSVNMLKVAETKRVYREIYCQFVGPTPLPVPNDIYDCVLAVGVIAPNHLPADALPDLCRVIKPGGYLMIQGNYEYWSQLPEYHVTMGGVLQRLVDDGAWEQVQWLVHDNYYTKESEASDRGLMFIYRKLAQNSTIQ